jgi:hypothetical protein
MLNVRLIHIWWLPAFVFLPSVLVWIYSMILSVPGFTHAYLPMFAAVLGLLIPLIALKRFRTASNKVVLATFFVFVTVMLAWGFTDIRHENYQIGGHDYPNGILVDGHRYYWHLYFTWYWLPYKSIHGYHFD